MLFTKKKIINFLIFNMFLAIICCLFLFVGCDKNDSDIENNTKPYIVSVGEAKQNGTEINLSVDKTTHRLELFNLIVVSEGSVWKVYDSNNNIIANKVISLDKGENVYYIETALPDGSLATTYTLKVFKSYDITINYICKMMVGNWPYTYTLTRKETIEQGEFFNTDYIPSSSDIFGADFVSWHLSWSILGFGPEFKGERLYSDTTLVGKLLPKPATLHLIVDGKEWQTIDTKYKEHVKLSIPEKEHYDFSGWYYDDNFGMSVMFNDYSVIAFGDIYVYGKFEPKT